MAFRQWRPAATEVWEKIAVPPDDRAAYFRAGYEEDPNHRGGMRKLMQAAAPALHYCAKVGKP